MTRGVLVTGLLGASLALGILTAIVQSHNRGEGARLDALREDCLLLEAVHGAQRATILEADHGPLPRVDLEADAKKAGQRARGAQ
ncbi:MAG: hypothetical protein NTY35_11260 [Planctomycetota bacterium]|nr:hypothetical protein [Planctomycetota bacterium]